jgi:hypothetical protein
MHRYAEASDWVTAAVSLRPSNSGLHNMLGLVLQRLQRLAARLSRFRSDLMLRPTLVRWMRSRCTTLRSDWIRKTPTH